MSVQRFILEQNLQRFRQRLAGAVEPTERRWLEEMVTRAERELALLIAGLHGVRQPWEHIPAAELEAGRVTLIAWFREAYAEVPMLAALVDPAPGLPFVVVNPAFERLTGMTREQIEGKAFFELFPDNPGDPFADGASNLYCSLRTVAETGLPHKMDLQRYDTKDSAGSWMTRYWYPENKPLHDGDGRLVFILHASEEVTGA